MKIDTVSVLPTQTVFVDFAVLAKSVGNVYPALIF